MKTLYISDLDGTLLGADAEVSDFTVDALNCAIDRGVHFSVATARTSATCDKMLQKVHINAPVILMNGALIYDFTKKVYLKKELLTPDSALRILSLSEKTGVHGFMYTLSHDRLLTYYKLLQNKAMEQFLGERVKKYNKTFIQTDDLTLNINDAFYFCFMDTYENIHLLYGELLKSEGLRIEKYKDIYSNDDLWYMEVFSGGASKYKAVEYVRHTFGYDRIIAFGDNLNDIPLFEASDECYAVENAKDELKKIATAIIGKNTEDGVAKWITDNAKIGC